MLVAIDYWLKADGRGLKVKEGRLFFILNISAFSTVCLPPSAVCHLV
jgi:hypothetical protein